MEAAASDPGPASRPLPMQMLLGFLFAAAVAVGLCASAVLRRKCGGSRKDPGGGEAVEQVAGWGVVKEALLGSLKWGCSREPEGGRWHGDATSPAMERSVRAGGAWDPRVDAAPSSPLWQRRILMGERCELLSFSGLIMYDEKGFPLHMDAARASHSSQQENPAIVVTTLKDLL